MGVCLSVIRVEAKLPREQGGVRRGERSVEEMGSRHGEQKGPPYTRYTCVKVNLSNTVPCTVNQCNETHIKMVAQGM